MKLIKKYHLRNCLFFLWTIITISNAYSQHFSVITYDERNGLNRNYINEIVRDSHGYYWLATEKGIIRFDGNHFTSFPLTEKFGTNSVVEKMHLFKNNLYLIYENHGCLKFNVDDLSVETITSEAADDVLQENDSTFYLLLKSRLLKINPTRKTTTYLPFHSDIKKIIHLNRGKITNWGTSLALLLPSQQLVLVDKKTFRIQQLLSLDTIDLQNSFGIYNDQLVFSGNAKLFCLNKNKKIRTFPGAQSFQYDNYTEWKHTATTTGYYILNNSKLFRFDKKAIQHIPFKELKNIELKNIFIQDSANILIGTNAGLIHLSNKRAGNYAFEEVNEPVRDRLRIRRNIIPWKENTLLLLGHPYNYLYEKSGTISLLTNKSASSYDAVRLGDKLYIATEDHGLQEYNYRTGHSSHFSRNFLPENSRHYCLLLNRKDSLLVSAVNDTLITYNFRTHQFKSYASPLPGKLIKTLRLDTLTGNYWMGTEGGGAFTIHPGFNTKTGSFAVLKNLHGKTIYDILFDANGRDVWFAHENGIDRIHKTTLQLMDSVPPTCFRNPRVVSLLQDNKNRIWMGTYAGIVAYDPTSRGLIKLTRLNGLINTEFNFSSACKVNDQLFIFGGLSGYDAVNPTLFPINTSLPIGLVTGYEKTKENRVEFHAYDYTRTNTIRFNTENESLRILLGSKNTLNATKYSYHYRFNKESWSILSDLSYINISKIQPGSYQLEIRAFDEFGTPVDYAPLTIEATLPFYKSRIFIISLSIISILSLIAIILLILRTQKRENELKENISMDLHDEIGTLLARAMLVAQTKDFPDKESHLSNYLSEALYGLRVYINTMNASNLTAIQLATEIKEMAHLSFSPLNYHFKMEEEGLEGIKLSATKFRCIKLCYYEILNNMIKHSTGNSMEISIVLKETNLHFSFIDNGSVKNLLSFGHKGNGLKNLKKRIFNQKGKLFFEIGPEGHGLVTKIEIPY